MDVAVPSDDTVASAVAISCANRCDIRRLRASEDMSTYLMDSASWATHRRAVVHTVRRHVPAVDPEAAANRGLAALCARIVSDGAVGRPADVWCEAALAAARDMSRRLLTVPASKPGDDEMPGADAQLRCAHTRETP